MVLAVYIHKVYIQDDRSRDFVHLVLDPGQKKSTMECCTVFHNDYLSVSSAFFFFLSSDERFIYHEENNIITYPRKTYNFSRKLRAILATQQ